MQTLGTENCFRWDFNGLRKAKTSVQEIPYPLQIQLIEIMHISSSKKMDNINKHFQEPLKAFEL